MDERSVCYPGSLDVSQLIKSPKNTAFLGARVGLKHSQKLPSSLFSSYTNQIYQNTQPSFQIVNQDQIATILFRSRPAEQKEIRCYTWI